MVFFLLSFFLLKLHIRSSQSYAKFFTDKFPCLHPNKKKNNSPPVDTDFYMHIYIYVRMYLYVCTHACIYVRVYGCMSVYVCMYMLVCTYVHMYVCMYVRIYACTYMCVCMCAMYICVH